MRFLLALCALLPLAAGAQTLPPLLQADGALNPDWRFVGFPKRHADLLSDQPAEQAALKAKTLGLSHLDYDWSLNDTGR